MGRRPATPSAMVLGGPVVTTRRWRHECVIPLCGHPAVRAPLLLDALDPCRRVERLSAGSVARAVACDTGVGFGY